MASPLILIADDEGASRELMSEILRASGYEVIGLADGGRLLEQVAARRPDLVLLDVMLGGADGRELCRRIKADPELGGIPIVLTSAMDEEDVNWRECGADAFRRKAANILHLPAFISGLLRDEDRA